MLLVCCPQKMFPSSTPNLIYCVSYSCPHLTPNTSFTNRDLRVIRIVIFNVNIGQCFFSSISCTPQGGVIARALFTLASFDDRLVHTIITQATPHSPVLRVDQLLDDFYWSINTVSFNVVKYHSLSKLITFC